MYCIIETGGKQAKVTMNQKLRIPRLKAEVGSQVELGKVLMSSDGKDIKIGNPVLKEARVDAKVLAHSKEKKILVFKMKRRKNYRRKNGHRQPYTEVQITGIQV